MQSQVPKTGLVVYNTDDNKLQFNAGTTGSPVWTDATGGAADGNFAVSNLTFSGNRSHDLAGNDLEIKDSTQTFFKLSPNDGFQLGEGSVNNNTSTKNTNVLIGTNAKIGATAAAHNYAIAIGNNVRAAGQGSIGIGGNSESGAVALGYASSASGTDSVAIGRDSIASNNQSVAIGIGTDSTSSGTVAIGYNAQSTNNSTISMGAHSIANGSKAIAIGNNTESTGNDSIAIGTGIGNTPGNRMLNSTSRSLAIGFAQATPSFLFAKDVTSYLNGTSNVVVGATSADASAKFQIDATDKGFLPPRMTTLQRDAISNPATGLVVYNTDDNKLQFNAGTTSTPVWTDATGAAADGNFAANDLVQTANREYDLDNYNLSFYADKSANTHARVDAFYYQGAFRWNFYNTSNSGFFRIGSTPTGGNYEGVYAQKGFRAGGGASGSLVLEESANNQFQLSYFSGGTHYFQLGNGGLNQNITGDLMLRTAGGGSVTPSARLHIEGADDLGSTNAFLIDNQSGTELFKVTNDGKVKISNAYELPTSDGSNGQILSTDGAGNLSFVDNSNLITTTITVPAASITNLHTNPYELISAPGANQYIELVNASASMIYGGTAFNLGTLTFEYNGSSNNIGTIAGFTNSTANIAKNMTSDSDEILINTALQLSYESTIAPGSGNSDIKVHLTYKVVSM